MTAKEKAIELLDNFSRTHVIGVLNKKGKLVGPYSSGYASIEVRNIRAKNSALIALDEILNKYNDFIQTKEQFSYWIEVKQEIEKL